MRGNCCQHQNDLFTTFGKKKLTDFPHCIHHFYSCGVAKQFDSCFIFNSSSLHTKVEMAISKTLGEAIERQSLAMAEQIEPVMATHDQLNGEIIQPSSIVAFANAATYRSPYDEFKTDRAYYWVRAKHFFDLREGFIPAQLVYSPYFPDHNEHPLWMPNSNGVASARTKNTAISRAILELIERDFFDACLVSSGTTHTNR